MSSSYRVSGAGVDSLSLLATCFDMVNQMVRLDIDPSGLLVRCTDHDDTIHVRYLLPVETTAYVPHGHEGTVCVRCTDLIQLIQNAQGCLQITDTVGSWTICDLAGNTTVWTASAKQKLWEYPNMKQYDCSLRIPTATFLLYVQHITLCESYVLVSSHGFDDLSMHADGELISIQIQNESPGFVVSGSHPYTVRCTFKYIRAMLAILQRVDQLEICITSGECLFWSLPVSIGTLSIFVKDVPIY